MGVDTNLFIGSQWTHEEIQSVIERTFKTKVTFEHTHALNYTIYAFDLPNSEHRRMSVFTAYEMNGFVGTLLKLSASYGSPVKIMTAIAETFGGFLQLFDTTQDYEGFESKLNDSNGLRFWSRYAIINGIYSEGAEFDTFVRDKKREWKCE